MFSIAEHLHLQVSSEARINTVSLRILGTGHSISDPTWFAGFTTSRPKLGSRMPRAYAASCSAISQQICNDSTFSADTVLRPSKSSSFHLLCMTEVPLTGHARSWQSSQLHESSKQLQLSNRLQSRISSIRCKASLYRSLQELTKDLML